jgi:hypothetical protein
VPEQRVLLKNEHDGITLLVPVLAVSEDNMLGAKIEEHRLADLAGERPFHLAPSHDMRPANIKGSNSHV